LLEGSICLLYETSGGEPIPDPPCALISNYPQVTVLEGFKLAEG
jgi:hypothetical protein